MLNREQINICPYTPCCSFSVLHIKSCDFNVIDLHKVPPDITGRVQDGAKSPKIQTNVLQGETISGCTAL